jgi:hypothetical protein
VSGTAELNLEAEAASLRQDWKRFVAGVFLFGFGFAMYNGVFQNFFKEAVGAKEFDLGLLESLREVPGLDRKSTR